MNDSPHRRLHLQQAQQHKSEEGKAPRHVESGGYALQHCGAPLSSNAVANNGKVLGRSKLFLDVALKYAKTD
jgi:hypothetical protein